jgi:hypothetical protein
MRTKALLRELDDVLVLYRHLYMNPENRIVLNNGMTDLEIRLDENLRFYCKNLSFPHLPDMSYDEQMTLSYCLGVIERLKEQRPRQFPESFESQWDEIKEITLSNMALNFYK